MMLTIKARSSSDLHLAEWVRQETGIEVSPWQLERWRRVGLIRPADHHYSGSGSLATYSSEARRQAAEVSRLSTRYRKTDELVRVAFYRGLYVREDALRRTFDGFIARMESWIGPAETDDDLDRIDHLAQRFAAMAERTKQGRGLKRRVRRRDESPEAIAAGVYYTLLYAISKGSLTSQDGLTDLLDATGISGLLGDQLAGIGPVAPGGRKDIKRFLRQASLSNVRVLLASASMSDLEESRELIRLCFPFFKSIGFLVSRWFDLPSSFGVAYLVDADFQELDLATWSPLGLVLLRPARTRKARELLAKMREHAAYFEQMAEFARSLPDDLVTAVRAGDMTSLERLPVEERDRIRASALSARLTGRGLSWAEGTGPPSYCARKNPMPSLAVVE